MSVSIAMLLGVFLEWPFSRSILIGFVISLSSTVVVLKILQDWNELDSDTGQNVLGILLVQDLAIVPMLIIISMLGGSQPSVQAMAIQIIGGVFIIAFMVWIATKESFHLPLSKWLKHDHEMQVFAALIICFGLAAITGLMELSTALGAFVAGMIIGTAKETQWVHHSLESFRIVFVALFFVSIGMLVNLNFVIEHWQLIILLVVTALITNTFINAIILRGLGTNWRDSLYASTLLSQIGEFSFVLAAVGLHVQLINEFGYQLAIASVAITLLISPAWILLIKRLLFKSSGHTLHN